MARIFFTGIKHSGKTKMAKLVSVILGKESADSDELALSRLDGLSVREFYRTRGKEAFMDTEYEVVREYVETHQDFILSLGGGAADNRKLMDYLKENGRIIYLRRDEEDMLPVILKHGVPPFLDHDDIKGSFHRVYFERDMKYSKYSDLTLDLGPYGDKDRTAGMIAEALKERNYV